MYSREEFKQLKIDFWQGFGDYAAALPQLARRKGKFMLYNTKVRGVELKFDAAHEGAWVILEVNHRNEAERFRLYEHFERYRVIFSEQLPDLVWEPFYTRESGQQVCRIYLHNPNLDLHRRSDWPLFYQWMATHMLRLERAFRTVKDTLE